MVLISEITKDLPLLAGLILILVGSVYAVSTIGLPGIGDFDNIAEIPSSTEGSSDAYDVTTQIDIGSTALGDTFVKNFDYQTQKSCTLCLNLADSSFLAVGGSNNVRAEVTVTNTDTGKTYVQTTKFLGEIGAGQTKTVHVNFDNARPGQYKIKYDVTYDPSVFDPTDFDNRKVKTFNFEVPKVSN